FGAKFKRCSSLTKPRVGGSVAEPTSPFRPHQREPMALFGRKRTTVGLDIGSGLIKLVVVNHGSGEPVLTQVAYASVVDDAIVEGEVMDPGLVADAVRGLLASAGVKA